MTEYLDQTKKIVCFLFCPNALIIFNNFQISGSIVSLLFLTIASSLTSSISFHSLMLNFNSNCPTESKIRFINYNVSESESSDPNILVFASNPTTLYKWEQLHGDRLQSLSRKMREHIDKRRDNEETTPDPLARKLKYMDIKDNNKEMESRRRQTLDEEDTQFFDSRKWFL